MMEAKMPMPKMQVRKGPTEKSYMKAMFVPGTVNAKDRTIEVTFSAGTKGLRRSWFGDYFEELQIDEKAVNLDRANNGASVLNNHQWWDLSFVLGCSQKAWIQDGQGRALLRISERPDVEPYWGDIKSGIIRNLSVGYVVNTYEEIAAPEGEPPTYRAIDWEVLEISYVTIPFDMLAQSRANDTEHPEPKYEAVFRSIVKSEKPAASGDEKKNANQLLKEGVRSMDELELEKQKQEAAAQAAEKAKIEERQRQTEIRSAAKACGLEEEFVNQHIDSGTSADQFRKLAIEKRQKVQDAAPAPAAAKTVVAADEADKYRDGASQWLIERAGSEVKSLMEKHTGKKIDGGEFRGMSLVDIARESLERSGVRTRGMSKMQLVGEAFTHRSGFNTTSDFPVILENTLHKVLLGAYMTTPDTWSRFCKRGSVSDFRANPRYRLGSFGSLDPLNEHGEFKNKSIPDAEKSSITAATKGNIIGLSRQAIINDDMGAFNDLATRYGRAAKLSVEVDVFAQINQNSGMGPTMADGQPLFHTSRKNVNTTGSALSAAGIDADRVLLGSQTDPSGNELLDLHPAILLVPLGLGGQAKVINASQYDPDNMTSGSKAVNKPNVVAGLFRDVVDTARLTGTRRYLFAEPSIAPVFEVAFLDGQESPFMESKEGWKMDGVEWKIRLDYGVAPIDPRGGVTNAGV